MLSGSALSGFHCHEELLISPGSAVSSLMEEKHHRGPVALRGTRGTGPPLCFVGKTGFRLVIHSRLARLEFQHQGHPGGGEMLAVPACGAGMDGLVLPSAKWFSRGKLAGCRKT